MSTQLNTRNTLGSRSLALAAFAAASVAATPAFAGDCDYFMGFEAFNPNAEWGGPAGDIPGTHLFNAGGNGGVPVIGLPNSNGSFGTISIGSSSPGFGSGQALNIININAGFDLLAIGCSSFMSFDFRDAGGTENLLVNGGTPYVGELSAAPFNIAPGVECTVTSTTNGGVTIGTVKLTGNLETVILGGQEFTIDNVCVTEGECEDQQLDNCQGDRFVSFNLAPSGMNWGDQHGTSPGGLIDVEDGIPWKSAALSQDQHEAGEIVSAIPVFGDVKMLQMEKIATVFEMGPVDCASTVRFAFLVPQDSTDEIKVNGAERFVGNLEDAPIDIAPGVEMQVDALTINGFTGGLVTLTGVIDRFGVGGTNMWIDNVCVTTRNCRHDLNCDGMVGFNDLTTLLANWGSCPTGGFSPCRPDFDEDSDVGFSDLVTLLANWGDCPPE